MPAVIPLQLQALFYFVRDEIRFGYPKNGDIVKASETIRPGHGQCNTNATLLVPLISRRR